MLWIFLSIVVLGIMIAGIVMKTAHDSKVKKAILRKQQESPQMSESDVERFKEANAFVIGGKSFAGAFVLSVVLAGAGMFNKLFFFADQGFSYQIVTFTGEEDVAFTPGWYWYGWGDYKPWKQAMTIQARDEAKGGDSNVSASANSGPINLVFLDQVDADASATVRFILPQEREQFLDMVHNYRTPSNLLNSELVASFQETLGATASLMSAEEYFSGGRTSFQNEFRSQMGKGTYVVKREEVLVDDVDTQQAFANASAGDDQSTFGDKKKVVFKVTKLTDENGQPIIKKQNFLQYGITVDAARVTDMDPNGKFKTRMEQKQEASADRAIAKEQRIQEEEKRRLAIAKGDREVAERQAQAKVNQIEKTTNAETNKQLALTAANQQKEQAAIQKDTSLIKLEQSKIDAERIKTLADAEAYERQAKLEADNGLKLKLDALVRMNADNAAALAKRQVPNQVIYSGAAGAGQMGTANELQMLTQTQLLKNLKALDLDMSVKKQ
jgi:regulator of protease activity HflC (stomatin/prohibitin superfamily)